MKKLLNILVIISIVFVVAFGVIIFILFKKSQKVDTSLLEMNTAVNRDGVDGKKGRADDTPSINLIFYKQNGEKELKDVVIEVLDGTNNQLTYVTVPLDTEIGMSQELYEDLSTVYTDIPQYSRLRQFGQIFKKDKEYRYAQLILDDILGIDSSYYTVITGEQASFQEYQKQMQVQAQGRGENELSALIKNAYEHISSNLSKKKKASQASLYANIPSNAITFTEIEGTRHTNSFEIDATNFQVFMSQFQ